MSKRIAMIAYTQYRNDARPRRAAEALAGRGDSVDFFALEEPDAPQHETLHGVQVHRLAQPRYRGASAGRYLTSYLSFFAKAMAAVTFGHLKRRYDVVYVHTMPDLMVFTGLAARLAGARIVIDVHDTMPELYQSKFGLPASHPLVRGLALQERLSCGFAHRVVCVHEPHKKLLVSRGIDPKKITVILNLPDPTIFGEPRGEGAVSESEGELRIVYHGTIAERLGLDTAVYAFRDVLPDFPTARFDIYGSGDYGPELASLIADLGLTDRVHFTNQHFRVDAVPGLLGGAALGVVPNRRDPATEYMLPVKLLEYVHLGIPVAAARLPAIEHYFGGDAVAYFAPGDSGELALVMRRLLASPAERAQLRQRASEFSRRYAWSTVKNDLFAAVDG